MNGRHKNDRIRFSIQTKLTAAFTAIVVVVVALLTSMMIRNSSRTLKEEALIELGTLVSHGSEVLLEGFRETRETQMSVWATSALVRSLINQPPLRFVFGPGLHSYFGEVFRAEPWLLEVVVAGDAGLLYSSRNFLNAAELPLRDRFKNMEDGTFYVMDFSEFVADEARTILVLKKNVTSDDRTKKGFVLAFYDFRQVGKKLFETVNRKANRKIFLVSLGKKGPLLAPKPKKIEGLYSPLEEELRTWKSISKPEPSKLFLYKTLESRTPNLGIVGTSSLESLQRPIQEMTTSFIYAGVLAVGVGLIFALLLSGRITKPIHELTEKVKLLSQGIPDVTVNVSVHDEIGILASNFNKMSKDLGRSQARLHTQIRLLQWLESENRLLALALSSDDLHKSILAAIQRLNSDFELQVEFFIVSEIPQRSLFLELKNGKKIQLSVERITDSLKLEGYEIHPCFSFVAESIKGFPGILVIDRNSALALGHSGARDELVIDSLFRAFTLTVRGAVQNIEAVRVFGEQVKKDSELRAAKAIQESILPRGVTLPAEIEVVNSYNPAQEIGGDWYTYCYDSSQDRVFMCIGDATGHGYSSGLLTAIVYGSFFTQIGSLIEASSTNNIPQENESILQKIAVTLNSLILESGNGTHLMSLFLLVLDCSTGQISFLNAGHPHPLLIRHHEGSPSPPAEKRVVEPLFAMGSLLGISEHPEFACGQKILKSGDALFLYTDGLIENSSADGRMLSRGRLRNILATSQFPDLSQLQENALAAARTLWKKNPPGDDYSTLLVSWKKK